jgi:hypothetical protein
MPAGPHRRLIVARLGELRASSAAEPLVRKAAAAAVVAARRWWMCRLAPLAGARCPVPGSYLDENTRTQL